MNEFDSEYEEGLVELNRRTKLLESLKFEVEFRLSR